MIDTTSVPSPNAAPEYHADFLELCALRSPQGHVSIHEFIRDLNLANADETLADSEDDDTLDDDHEVVEPLAEAAFQELDERVRACGVDSTEYPFKIDGNSVTVQPNAERCIYTFLALLSWFGKDAGPTGASGEKLFEELCGCAAASYLGGPDPHVKWFVFGFPRRTQPKGFKDALDALCKAMGEGEGHRQGRAKLPHEKDAKLDVVAWREFNDLRQGKLITFGQCATGADWVGKVSELPPPVDWCTTWMADRPSAWPFRSFFVPHRVDRTNWFDTCVKAGILHDRCRISSLSSAVDEELRDKLAGWSSHVLSVIRTGGDA